MKNKFLLFLPIVCLFLSSCFEIEETYNLNADGSYTSNYDVDMGGLVGMAMSMMPDSAKNKPEFKDGKDTTFNMASKMPDSLKESFSTEELKLLQNTDMNLRMKITDGVFKVGFSNKGKSVGELSNFITNFGKLLKKGRVDNIISNSLGENSQPAKADDSDNPLNNDEYTYVITNDAFERKIKPDLIAVKQKKNQQVYEMIKGMNIKMTNTVTINLPKPAKSIDNPKAILSADRKQFKLVIDMFEALEHPDLLNFKVNY